LSKNPRTDESMRSTVHDYEWIIPNNDAGEPIEGIKIKYMGKDPEDKGVYTRLLIFEPGFNTESFWTGEFKNQKHTFWEEVFVIKGHMMDYGTNKLFTEGYYGLRSPGSVHGPYGTDIGCLIMETTWRDREWYEKNLGK